MTLHIFIFIKLIQNFGGSFLRSGESQLFGRYGMPNAIVPFGNAKSLLFKSSALLSLHGPGVETQSDLSIGRGEGREEGGVQYGIEGSSF